MRTWNLYLIALSLVIAPAPFLAASAQQESQPEFVPGELIVGYKSPEAKAAAVPDFKQLETQGGIRRSDATSTEIKVEPVDDTTVRLKFNFVTRGVHLPQRLPNERSWKKRQKPYAKRTKRSSTLIQIGSCACSGTVFTNRCCLRTSRTNCDFRPLPAPPVRTIPSFFAVCSGITCHRHAA